MSRTIDATTLTALTQAGLNAMWIVRLDIQNDPLYVHTGIGSLTFGGAYDVPLQTGTYLGLGNIGQISPITDTVDGSQSLTLSLPGVDLTNDYLHQLIGNADLWQRRPAYVWFALLDSAGAILGKPFRVKTGRMDTLPIIIDPDNHTGTISVVLESQQAYSAEALFSKYSEQKQIDSTDTSQDFIGQLANKIPEIGNTSSNAQSTSSFTSNSFQSGHL